MTALLADRGAVVVGGSRGIGASVAESLVDRCIGEFGGTGYPAGKGAVNSLTPAIGAELKGECGVSRDRTTPRLPTCIRPAISPSI